MFGSGKKKIALSHGEIFALQRAASILRLREGGRVPFKDVVVEREPSKSTLFKENTFLFTVRGHYYRYVSRDVRGFKVSLPVWMGEDSPTLYAAMTLQLGSFTFEVKELAGDRLQIWFTKDGEARCVNDSLMEKKVGDMGFSNETLGALCGAGIHSLSRILASGAAIEAAGRDVFREVKFKLDLLGLEFKS